MAEVHFYHLESQPLERVLPTLLKKALERRWRVVVQAGSDERVEWLSNELWTFSDESFLPHGSARDGHAERQPVWITAGADSPNRPQLRIYLDAVPILVDDRLERIIYLFDARDPEALEAARAEWRRAASLGLQPVYWREDERGRWTRKVSSA
jgi:DNA polymerase III subunit chi